MRFKDKVAVVTGAAQGIGEAYALAIPPREGTDHSPGHIHRLRFLQGFVDPPLPLGA